MKQFIYHSLKSPKTFILLFISIITLSCVENEKKDSSTNEESSEKEMAQLEEHLISLDEAFQMYDTYGKERVQILRDTLHAKYGKEFYDTRTVWFDITTLKSYIERVEKISESKQIKPGGFKICFGVHSPSGEYANHQNVFIVPTSEKDNRQAAYTVKNDEILFLMDARPKASQTTDKAAFFSFSSMLSEGLILNDGGLIPPPYFNDPDFE